MKKIPQLTLTLTLSSLLSLPGGAQTVPGNINYQARITDANGMPIGSTGTVNAPVAAPVNRKVRFRIYDAPTGSGTSRKWSEEQTVTISLGELNVLLGDNQGTGVTGEPNTGGFASVFTNLTGNSAARYLGITVDNGNSTWGAEDVEVTPRQQITPTGFALRAKVAEALASGNVSTPLALLHLKGIGSSGATAMFQSSTSSESVSLSLRDNSGQEKGLLGMAGQDAALSSASATGDTVLRTSNGNKLLFQNGSGAPGLVVRDNKVGIGTVAPGKMLQVGDQTVDGSEGLIRLGARATSGGANRLWDVGVPNGLPATGKNFSFIIDDTQFNAPDPEFILQYGTGNLGLGILNPSVRLDVKGGAKFTDTVESAANLLANKISAQGTDGFVFKSGGDTDGGLFSPGDGVVTLNTNNAERLRINSLGNVSIGSTTANAKLDVSGTIRTNDNELYLRGGTDIYAGLGWYGGPRKFDTLDTFDGPVLYGAGGGALGTRSNNARNLALTWSSDGTVGIGGNAANDAKLSVIGTGPSPRTIDLGIGFLSEKVSLYTSGSIHTSAVRTASDERIKIILGRSDGAEDLRTLGAIEISNYTHRDTFTHGSGVSKKVIAQQLEKVFPQAVRQSTGVIPDIYEKAPASADGWVKLHTDLKTGERVSLASNRAEGVYEVLETGDGKFRTDFKTDESEVFVYGRQVKDFRTVDYDAVSMLNVSATQQLKREKDGEIRQRDVKIAALEAQLAQLATRDKDQEARLARLEKALAAADTPPPSSTPSEAGGDRLHDSRDGAKSAIRTASR